jgi:2-keto-myo-inositol isomerase
VKLGLNGSTTDQCNLEEDIIVAEQAGFDIVEPRTYKIKDYLDRHSLEDLASLYKQAKVKPYAINAIEFFNLKASADEKDDMLQETEYWCKIASTIGCPYIIAVPSRLTKDVSEQHIIDDTVGMLREMSEIASRYHVKLAFEFIGFDDFSVRTLELANKIITETDRENIGLVIDTIHFYLGDSTIESIKQMEKDKLFIFHINDAEDVPKKEFTEALRLFPGLGILPLNDIGQALNKIGYDKVVSLELFRPEYWRMEKQELADQAFQHVKEATESMFKNRAY